MKKTLYLFLISILLISCGNSQPEPISNTTDNGGEAYDNGKTVLIHSVNTNYLVRGNEPLLADGSSAYNEINDELKKQIGGNFDLKNYTFIDISLISSQPSGDTPPNERFILFDEFLSFGYPLMDTLRALNLNPTLGWPPYYGWNTDSTKAPWNTYNLYGNKIQVEGNMYNGQFVWWPIQACSDTLPDCIDVVGEQYGFTELIDFIYTLMNEKTNTVIYFHCIHGHDRTSVVNAGYIIRHLGVSFEQATTNGAPKGGMKPKKSGGYDPLKQPYWNMLYVWDKNFNK